MGRIPPDRPGYSGFACQGEFPYVIPPQACLPPSGYKYIPPNMACAAVNEAFENLSLLESDTRLHALKMACALDYDPFTGAFIDMAKAFLDNGLDPYIEHSCYEAGDEYAKGYMNPNKKRQEAGC